VFRVFGSLILNPGANANLLVTISGASERSTQGPPRRFVRARGRVTAVSVLGCGRQSNARRSVAAVMSDPKLAPCVRGGAPFVGQSLAKNFMLRGSRD